jgi:alkylated DNA repair dioxygenase AlkB
VYACFLLVVRDPGAVVTYDLFSASDEYSDYCRRLDMPDADVTLYPFLFSQAEADHLQQDLLRDIVWRQESIKLYGRDHSVPRLTALYGDPDKTYRYSGITHQSESWIPALLTIKQRIEAVSNTSFNSVLLNHYRDGADSMGWHADDEPELGPNPVIGSVSFGQSRILQMRHKTDKSLRQGIPLANGSFLLMQGPVQHHWLHQVAKSRRPMGARINLTYRFIL